MSITATELKTNLSKYLLLSATEDIYITRNGKVISKLTNPFQDRVEMVESLVGIIPDTMTLEEARDERLAKIRSGFRRGQAERLSDIVGQAQPPLTAVLRAVAHTHYRRGGTS